MIKNISTSPYTDQKMGTAGIRKKVPTVQQPNYIENFMQSLFDAIGGVEGKTFVLGSDGRYYNDVALQKIIKMSAANGMKKLIIGQNGMMSTPASSCILLKNHADGGLMLTASHNPGGINGDFGIKYATQTGGQCSSLTSDKIYARTKEITSYKTLDAEDVNLSLLGTQFLEGMEIEVIDPIEDYLKMMESIFDFDAIKKLFKTDFSFVFDAMNAVTGPYAIKIFEEVLGAEKGSVHQSVPLPDFGGLHPDPNLVYAKHLVDLMYSDNAPDFAAANDGDGDRNMILGKKFFVSPSDSLAILTDNYYQIPAYKNGISGVAKSAATSTAVERVASNLGINYFEVPTGWKNFCNLMDSNLITFCGEESFGTSSSHIREKDGIWAVLFWLNIIANTGKSVEQITRHFWAKYGRTYYLRFDFEGIDTAVADTLMNDLENKLPSLAGTVVEGYRITKAHPFVYTDPVDKQSTKNGLLVYFEGGSRICFRLSGTGTNGATLRVYIETYEKTDFDKDPKSTLETLLKVAMILAEIKQRTSKDKPDIIT